jgi:hypothetical protein
MRIIKEDKESYQLYHCSTLKSQPIMSFDPKLTIQVYLCTFSRQVKTAAIGC